MATAIYPGAGNGNINYPTLGLANEVGEVAGVVKKAIRDDGGVLNEDKREMLVKELGDVLWYVAALCTEVGVNMEYVASKNLSKLSDRKDRGTLTGSGDDR